MTRIASIEPVLARVGIRNQLLVKVTTESGIVGWGESGLSAREESVAATIRHFSDFLIGQDSRKISRIWQETYRSQYFEGGRVLTAAMSAIDIALYDILGKGLEVPVYQLLGGRQRDVIPTFGCCTGKSVDDLVENARTLVKEGWTSIRINSSGFETDDVFDPRASLTTAVEELTRIRKEFGPGLCLGIDLHHRLSVAETASFCNMLPAGTVDYIEEPIRDESPEAYASLRTLTNIPFAIGEEFSSKWQAVPYLERGLTQYMRIDICNIGGFTEAMKVAGWSECHYVDVMPHNPLGPICTAATVHFSAAVPNFAWLETRQSSVEQLGFHDPDIFPQQVQMDGPVYIVPDGPGLGVEVNEDIIRQQIPEHAEPPHLRRPDGSVTNW